MDILHTCWRWFLHASIIQLFLTLISLPILTAWGLPLSYLTPIGTLLFTPVLTLYLCCALAVFITTLCCIPNSYCITALHLVSSWWLWALSLIETPWQIGFVCPPLYTLAAIPVSAFALIFILRKKHGAFIALALAALLLAWIGMLRMLPTISTMHVAHANTKKITAFFINSQVTVVDDTSCCSSIVDGCSWVLHQMMPEITKKTGATHIDRFIILHPRQRTFEALTALCNKGVVHDVYLPCWEGKLSWQAWRAYAELRDTIKAYGYKMHYLKRQETLVIDANHEVIATETIKKYGEATYQLFEIISSNDKINDEI